MTISIYLIIHLLFVIGSTFLIQYFTQKAKNKANQEDIKKLTHTIEEVKQKFNEENELLRSNLNLLTSKSHFMFTEEKEALAQFQSSTNKMKNDLILYPVYEYDLNNYHDITTDFRKTNENLISTQHPLAIVQLIVRDIKLVDACENYYNSIVNFDIALGELLDKLYDTYFTWHNTLKSNNADYTRFNDEETLNNAEDIDNEYSPIIKNIKEDNLNKLKELKDDIVKKRNEFLSTAREYLNKSQF